MQEMQQPARAAQRGTQPSVAPPTAGLLTTQDVQRLVRVDRSTIYRMAEAGRIPAVKVGRQWRFPAEELDAWLREHVPMAAHRPSDARRVDSRGAGSDLRTILPVDAIQSAADLLADLMGVMVVVTDVDGTPVTEVSNPCGLFEVVRSAPGALERCIADWRRLGDDLDLAPAFRPGNFGFVCARAFIRVGDRLEGMVIVGGIAPEVWPLPAEDLSRLAADLGVPTGELVAHANEIFHQGDAEQRRILELLPRISVLISRLASERSRLVSRLDAIATLAGETTTRSEP